MATLQETNISHIGKRKIIFKHAFSGGYVSSLEGNYSPQNNCVVQFFNSDIWAGQFWNPYNGYESINPLNGLTNGDVIFQIQSIIAIKGIP